MELYNFLSNNSFESTGKSAVDKVTDYIKKKIIYRELVPGDKIPTEAELCQILNVGRGSVREALKILATMNLIHIRRGDGTYISNPEDILMSDSVIYKMILNDISVSDMVHFREQIEIAALNLAIRNATEDDIEALRANVEKFTVRIKSSPTDSLLLHNLDMEFHSIFARATHNKFMEEVYLLAMNIFSPTILENFSRGQALGADAQATLESHSTLICALTTRNPNLGIHGIWQMLDIWRRWFLRK